MEKKKSGNNNEKLVQGGTIISVQKANKYRKTVEFLPYRTVFDPTPKQKWHKQLVAMIPPVGREMEVPLEFEWFPYAKYEWLRIMELNKKTKTIKPEMREMLYGYCLMVERRKRCILEWDGDDKYAVEEDNENRRRARMDYLGFEINRLSNDILKVGLQLGVFPKLKNKKRKEEEPPQESGEVTVTETEMNYKEMEEYSYDSEGEDTSDLFD